MPGGTLSKQLRATATSNGAIVLLGLPGAGKSTQAKLLAESVGLQHISTGDLVRVVAEEDTARGQLFRGFISEGKLVPDEHILPLFKDACALHPGGLVVDGYPRTLVQATGLTAIVPTIRRVLLLDLPIPVAMSRLLARSHNDDAADVIVKRMLVFTSETGPVASFYTSRKLLSSIDANGTVEEVHERVMHAANVKASRPSDLIEAL